MSQSAHSKQQLQDAFELFNQVSEQLSGSYQQLQQQVVSLSQELAAARSERSQLLAEIRALQQEASRGQRLSSMGEMTARLAHQVRTPLSTALLYASQLKQPDLRRDQHDCFVERLLVGLHHLDHMVNDMLVFARGGQCGEEAVSLCDLLERVQQTLLPQLNDKAARWSLRSEREDIAVRGQSELLASVLGNLATNALNACGREARLEWQIDAKDGYARLTLQDNGPGIADDLQEKIFEPFFTTCSNGTGLGLAVVRAVLDAHQGKIEIDSGYKAGARFVLQLPLLEMHQQLPSEMQQDRQMASIANSRCL
jgi:two-component system sensor histidine kinase FlrB